MRKAATIRCVKTTVLPFAGMSSEKESEKRSPESIRKWVVKCTYADGSERISTVPMNIGAANDAAMRLTNHRRKLNQ